MASPQVTTFSFLSLFLSAFQRSCHLKRRRAICSCCRTTNYIGDHLAIPTGYDLVHYDLDRTTRQSRSFSFPNLPSSSRGETGATARDLPGYRNAVAAREERYRYPAASSLTADVRFPPETGELYRAVSPVQRPERHESLRDTSMTAPCHRRRLPLLRSPHLDRVSSIN